MSMMIQTAELMVPRSALSMAEKACLLMVAEGMPVPTISSALEMPPFEVEGMLSLVEDKLGASNRLHAVSIAMRQGHIGF
jgi:DNA-binding CsgD family transcriptional regulator